jgi:hypothetical protein
MAAIEIIKPWRDNHAGIRGGLEMTSMKYCESGAPISQCGKEAHRCPPIGLAQVKYRPA